jgi:hypothetical protein
MPLNAITELSGYEIRTIVTGAAWRENCYVVCDRTSGQRIVIDPGGDADLMVTALDAGSVPSQTEPGLSPAHIECKRPPTRLPSTQPRSPAEIRPSRLLRSPGFHTGPTPPGPFDTSAAARLGPYPAAR